MVRVERAPKMQFHAFTTSQDNIFFVSADLSEKAACDYARTTYPRECITYLGIVNVRITIAKRPSAPQALE